MLTPYKRAHLAVAWSGLPPYAAYCLAELNRVFPGKITILGTHPDVPHQGLEDKIGHEVRWLSRARCATWDQLRLPRPDHFIHTGWAYPAFNSLRQDAKRGDARCYGMIDNMWYGTLKQRIGSIYLRRFLRRSFNAVLVPGQAGRRFCRRLGIPNHLIYGGLYGANPEIFPPGPPLSLRPKRMLFVGRLIRRKGVPVLLKAIRNSSAIAKGWEFVFIGEGPLDSDVRSTPGVQLEPFSSPGVIAKWMRASRYLLLPSIEEHWGVVVHEAAMSGCGLVLTKQVGASEDLLDEANGKTVMHLSPDTLQAAIDSLTLLTNAEQEMVFRHSTDRAANFGPKVFASSVMRMLGLAVK